MGMRKEYRPFDAELAKKGAPYALSHDDGTATIYHYDKKYIIGMIELGGGATPASWNLKGEGSFPLCMIPIATCQSKPVYVGDTLYDANGERFEVEVGHTVSMLKECTWDAPVKKVETRITSHEFVEITKHCKSANQEWFAIANAAIARAIADGDVVTIDVVKEIAAYARKQGEETYLFDKDVWEDIIKKFFKD